MNTSNKSSMLAMLSTDVDSGRLLNIVLIIAHLISFSILIAVSVYVVRVMCTTFIIHLNLRFLFVWLCLGGMLFSAGILYRDAVNLLLPSRFPFAGSLPDQILLRFGVYANIYVTPLLVVERIVATLNVNNYENNAGWRVHLPLYTLMLLVLGVTTYSAVKEALNLVRSQRQSFLLATMVFTLLEAVCGVAMFVKLKILLLVLRYNERSYKEDLQRRNKHSLSERYQRSENIRAGRQLLPVVLLQVHLALPSCVFIYLTYVGALGTPLRYVTYSNVISLLACWMHITLEISIIMFHPILRRGAISTFRRYFHQCCRQRPRSCGENRVEPPIIVDEMIEWGGRSEEVRRGPISTTCHSSIKTIDGRVLIPCVEDKQAEHFNNLATLWAMHREPAKRHDATTSD